MVLTRGRVLAGLLGGVLLLSYVALSAVLTTVVFAVTVAYVLYPLRQLLSQRGLSRRLASTAATLGAFLVCLAFLVPLPTLVYLRQAELVATLEQIPDTVTYTVGEAEYTLQVGPVLDSSEEFVRTLAVDMLVATPRIALEALLFVLVLYGILYRPTAVREAIFGFVPSEYHDIVDRLHARTQATLYSIYVVQAATAAATFVIAVALFLLLGYTSPFWLALVAGVLQFVPVLGPSILLLLLASVDVVILEMPVRGVAVLGLGLFFVALAPDAVLRPKFASRTGLLSPTLYFVGFVGGILTVGAIGFIVGPLVVALLVEVVELLSEDHTPVGSS
ncbi:MAG: AI-2E family transporter [Halovenus sp.]